MCNISKKEFYDIAVKESSDLIEKIKEHPFNVELMNNTLDYEKFKFYLQQDFLYVADCTRALLIIAAKANDIEIMDKLTNVAVGTFATRDYYKEHFADCDLSDSHRKSKSCSAFTDFFMRVAYHNSVAEGLAASYPCFCIYQMVIRYIVESGIAPNNKYQKWIDFFNTEMANNMMDDVTKIMNKLYKKYSNDERKNMLEFFRNGLELELAFWDEIYYFDIPQGVVIANC
ncbi:TenA family protein [Wolbachia endosymbiont of Ctenocephalides felis wCfeJ]|uniref:TenA family protein n=1 Tax=Wolbachia endosymbiont of Ctenocephalides felis wCfeJ TaxID=2732594 RepID=UPI00144500B8|nr:TenA family protein [Wolbachia endosymbiont of Ctenocephalides felis wCfeJ]WCR58159.1 MAG: Aminopyrimidine aminohydrolase [Wolbachia endosymbiont of Ctenocephalides felis wCfeJ]